MVTLEIKDCCGSVKSQNQTHLALFLFSILVMASPQIGRVKSKRVLLMDARPSCLQGHFWTCYWYHAHFTEGTGKCKRSAYYCYCRRYWMRHFVGHIPLGLSRTMLYFLKKANHNATAGICGKQINQGPCLGLEIPVIYKIYGGKEIFWWTGLTYLWQWDCKESLIKRKRWRNFDWWTEEAEINQKRQRQS